jgi:4-hydroxy-3-polyprenylbenzoate decarboxylase
MAFKDLSEFIHLLEQNGQLKRISTEVSPELEITEITDRISKGPLGRNVALLFENVKGSDSPVLINSMGHPDRMAWALGADDLNELGQRLAELIDMRLPQGAAEMMARAGKLINVIRSLGIGPSVVRNAPVQQVVHTGEEVDLAELPVLKCWPDDAGRFITLPTVVTRDPVSGTRNVGMYRLQVRDRNTLSMHWQLHKGGAEHARSAEYSHHQHLPVAVSLGGDPAITWAGSAPLPPGIDEFLLAGWLRGKAVELTPCVTQPLEVPAHAEFVIEGYVDPNETAPEGPFGDHTGHYTPVADYPVMHVTAITHRRSPIYPTTIVGIPPMEDYWMGKATERLFLPLTRMFLNEIVDISMPAEGVFHNLLLVSIRKRYPGHARKVINGIWGLGLMMLTKCIVVLDHDIDIQDTSSALFHTLNNVDWKRDVIIQEGPVDALDHASYLEAYGGKIGIDATRKLPQEGYTRSWPKLVGMSDDVKARVDAIWTSMELD